MSLEDRLYPLLAFYERLPDPVRRLGGAWYRALPQRWRLGAAFADFEALAVTSETWDRDDIRQYQLTELRRVLEHARRTCPYYQRRFAESGFASGSVEGENPLEGCPYLEKRDLIEHRESLCSTVLPVKSRLYITTGGSTGVPVGFYLQKGVSRPKEQAFLEAMWRRAGYFQGARLAVIRGQVTSDRATGRIAFHDATRDWLMLSSYHLTESRWPEYLDALERFGPDLLHAYPSAALQLAEALERAGQSWRIPLRALLCGSERLDLPQKRLLERVFGCRVYRWYGHSERVVLAGEGSQSEQFHFWPSYGYVEFGSPDDEGLREVIGTSFHNLAMPLIRYRTGDYVRLRPPDPVPHGEESARATPRQLPRLPGAVTTSDPAAGLELRWPTALEIAGREHEFLVSAGGRRISLTAFNMHSAIFDDLYAVQFYQAEPGIAEFRYVPGPHFHRSRLETIEKGIRRKLGDDFQIVLREMREVQKTARGKHLWLVSPLTKKP